MPPKPKRSRQEMVDAAVELIRQEGKASLSARSLAGKLGISASAVFTHFESMEQVQTEAMQSIRAVYDTYVARGLAMNPPFKGFGMEMIRFASEEPRLFDALFLDYNTPRDLNTLIADEGHREWILGTIRESFRLNVQQATWLYQNLWVYIIGIAVMSARGIVTLAPQQISEMLGTTCRGLLMQLHAPDDPRVRLVPTADRTIEGKLESYLENTLQPQEDNA